jgi:hypothetical protein
LWYNFPPNGNSIVSEDGELYVSDNDFEDKGERAIAGDHDRVWHIKNAKKPQGTIEKPDWYGFTDISADGLPVWHDRHLPKKGKPAEPLIENPPEWAGPPAYFEKPHSGMTKMEFCNSDAFGHKGRVFACIWGTLAPLNSPRERHQDNGFCVKSIEYIKELENPSFKIKSLGWLQQTERVA